MTTSTPEATTPEPSTPARPPRLYRHTKRDEWGLGIVLERLGDRSIVRFQDGQTRTLLADYLHLLDAVDRPLDVTLSVVRALTDRPNGRGKEADEPVSLDEQIAYFTTLYADGFQDEEYLAHHRGDGRKRPLKRHRDALIEAAAVIAPEALGALTSGGDFKGVHEAMKTVLDATDLVSPAERRAFAAIKRSHYEPLATTLSALLYGTAAFPVRFDTFVRTLEKALSGRPSWPLATVFLAATSPNEHLVVRDIVAAQARWMAPTLAMSKTPGGHLYARLLEMTQAVRERLVDADLAPRDLFDLNDFMWTTLRPKAQKAIKNELRKSGVTNGKKSDSGKAAA
ncbi:MAG: hypothetical protein AB7S26_21400 [Sandaracinaceae bacterium]